MTERPALRNPQVILWSADVARASDFYRRLGFVETFRTPPEGRPIHVDMELDGYKIGFAAIESAIADHALDPVRAGQRASVTLWTDDVEATYAALTGAGVNGLAAPTEWLGRLLIAWVLDPDGHPIQLAQSLAA